MKLKPKFIQIDCVEGNKIDPRQSRAVLKHKPDIILFEIPASTSGPGTVFNRYSCQNKPVKKVSEIIKSLKVAAKGYPYAKSDILVWKNIENMWKRGINTQIYNVDSPSKLRKEFYLFQKPLSGGYPAVRKDWLFWVYLYLRDSYMAKNIRMALDNYSDKKNPVVLIFLQSVHWKHVKFLLTNPPKEKIWKYYFRKFKHYKANKDMEKHIGKRSKVLKYFWKKNQKFY